MTLKTIGLESFRNLADREVSFSGSVNILKGENGQGKTNILEALYLLSTGKNFRAAELKGVSKEGTSGFCLSGKLKFDSICCNYSTDKGKILLLNEKKVPINDYLTVFPSIVFTNKNMQILRGYPEERRRFIDRGIAREETNYIFLIRDVKKIINSRNILLKTGKKEELYAWNAKLAEKGARMIEKRGLYIEVLGKRAARIYKMLFPECGKLDMYYSPCLENNFRGSVEEKLIATMEQKRKIENKKGFTIVGPHRDSVDVKINGRDIAEYGSSGQLKAAVISMKIAMTEIMLERKGFLPALEIDDINSELDNRRVSILLEYIAEKGQVFITTTDKDMSVRNGAGYTVCNGEIHQE